MTEYLRRRVQTILEMPSSNRPRWSNQDLQQVSLLLSRQTPELVCLARIEGLATFEPLGSSSEHRKQIWRVARKGLGLPT